jgi:DNA polymerase-3 subunit delta'
MLFDDESEDDFINDMEADLPAPVDELPLPRNAVNIIGHREIEQQLLTIAASGKMPHAMIFAGLQGIGKSTMAYRLVKFLLTRKEEDTGPSLFGTPEPSAPAATLSVSADDAAVKLIISGGHPDLLTIEREYDEAKSRFKETVAVDQIRKVNPFMHLTPFMGGKRIVVIDDADTMNNASQNALLKVLEEPPANAILILIAHRPGALMPTVRSRCRMIEFSPLAREDFNALLEKQTSDLDALYNISGGSIGMAQRLMADGALKSVEKISSLLATWPQLNWADIHGQAEVLGGRGNDVDDLQGFQDALLWICEQIAKARARGLSTLPKPLNGSPYTAMLADYSLEGWSKICDNLRAHFDMVKYGSIDKRQAILGAFSILTGK